MSAPGGRAAGGGRVLALAGGYRGVILALIVVGLASWAAFAIAVRATR